MDKSDPITKVTRFQLADSTRLARKRSPEDFKTILNYSNTLSDGLKTRRGYTSYTGIVYPTGLGATSCDAPFVCPIEHPEQTDVHILCMASDPMVYMYPHWRGSTKQNSSMALSTSYTPGYLSSAWSLQIVSPETKAHAFKIQNITLFGGIGTSGYYDGWKVYNTDTLKSTLIKTSVYDGSIASGGTDSMMFYCVDDLSATGLNFTNLHTYKFYKNYHENHSFNPIYNPTLSDPPCATTDNSTIFFSGGQGSNTNNRGSIIFPRMNKTFFPGTTDAILATERSFSINGTYVCEEELKAVDIVTQILFAGQAVAGTSKNLEGDATYWVAVAPIYDGGQIGKLTRYETPSFYVSSLSSPSGQNFIASAGANTVIPSVVVRINSGEMNKSLIGFAICMAKDSGDTRTSGRQTPYYIVGRISVMSNLQIVDTEGQAGSNWLLLNGYYQFSFLITQVMWDERENTYEEDSGMAEIQLDIAYAYSGRKIVGGKHYLYNVYVNSESGNDKQRIFTNPIGQNASINSGIPATRCFPNEEGFYRIGVMPDLGSKINAVIPVGFDEMLVLKDRGVVAVRPTVTQDLLPEFISRIVDHRKGCSTFNGYALSNQEEIYFAGYDDCYMYKAGQLVSLIERSDARDWLYTYREVLTNAQKESATVIWLPQRYIMWDFGQVSGNQYVLDSGGWTQAAYNQTSGLTSTEFFKFPSYLRNGTVIAVGTAGNKGIRQFQNPTTGAFYTTDGGVAIKTQLDTDYFNFGHDKDFVINKIIFNRTFDSTPSGQLDVSLYRDRSLVRVYTLDKTRYRVYMHSKVGDPKIGFEWRFIYNNNSSPELASGSQMQIDSIEIYGELRSRSKRATEVTTVTDVLVWDVDTWDGGKSWG